MTTAQTRTRLWTAILSLSLPAWGDTAASLAIYEDKLSAAIVLLPASSPELAESGEQASIDAWLEGFPQRVAAAPELVAVGHGGVGFWRLCAGCREGRPVDASIGGNSGETSDIASVVLGGAGLRSQKAFICACQLFGGGSQIHHWSVVDRDYFQPDGRDSSDKYLLDYVSPSLGPGLAIVCGFSTEVRCENLRSDARKEVLEATDQPEAFVLGYAQRGQVPVCLSAAAQGWAMTFFQWNSQPPAGTAQNLQEEYIAVDRAIRGQPGPSDSVTFETAGDGRLARTYFQPSEGGGRSKWRAVDSIPGAAKVDVQAVTREARWRGVAFEAGATETIVRRGDKEAKTAGGRAIPAPPILPPGAFGPMCPPEEARRKAIQITLGRVHTERLVWSRLREEVAVYLFDIYVSSGKAGAIEQVRVPIAAPCVARPTQQALSLRE